VLQGASQIIFNQAATGDGKSLAFYLAGLLEPRRCTIGLYPTIELIADQARQLLGTHDDPGYLQRFGVADEMAVDTLYGAELSRRVAAKGAWSKYRELWRSLRSQNIILTNPDIFHLVSHFRYQDSAYNKLELPQALARFPDLFVADEFHIFGPHQEAAILNTLLLIRASRISQRPLRCLFTSATPKSHFLDLLRRANFEIKRIEGEYTSQAQPGYRQITQPVTLEFVPLDADTDSRQWLVDQAAMIRSFLQAENGGAGRGLIILNSVAQVSRVVGALQAQFEPSQVLVREISGRIDRQERHQIQAELKDASQAVLVVATSAVDVGVDFKIHLLIFETSDSATFIQRLGRLGRHQGFEQYRAFVLLPIHAPWIFSRLEEQLQTFSDQGIPISRMPTEPGELAFTDVIQTAFDPPREFQQYRKTWGALQAQGLLHRMWEKRNSQVIEPFNVAIREALEPIYGEQLAKKRAHWCALGKDKVGQAVQEELLRFRGGSDLQAAVQDGTRFYTYSLLRLLPYVAVEVLKRADFLTAAQAQGYDHAETEFDDRYITAYLKVNQWLDQRLELELETDLGPEKITPCTLGLIKKVHITGHPQSDAVSRHIRRKSLLAFVVDVAPKPSSHWKVSQALRLGPLFGLYRLIDVDENAYACAFNQDALLLESLKWRLKACENTKPYIC
jgi:CRISPR-associated endonuclease/helicase Cas3